MYWRIKESRVADGKEFLEVLYYVYQRVSVEELKRRVFSNGAVWDLEGESGFTLSQLQMLGPLHVYKLYPDNLVFKELFRDDDGEVWLGLVKADGLLYGGHYFSVSAENLECYFSKGYELECPSDEIPEEFMGDVNEGAFFKALQESEDNLVEALLSTNDKGLKVRYEEMFNECVEDRFEDGAFSLVG